MAVNVAINGFGRIGRMVFRAGCKDPKINFVAVNDLTDAKTLAYLLKHDSVHGCFTLDVKAKGNNLVINGKELKVIAEKDPAKLPWKKLKTDIVVESTGRFTDSKLAKLHLKAGAKKVLISAPAKNPDITIVPGVNSKDYNKAKHAIISMGSCTTNCLAPVAKVLLDNFGIKSAFMTTVHAYTADQRLMDAPHRKLRRGRAAASNIVPTTTGATKSVAEVIPKLKGKMDGMAIRVPVINGSIVDFVAQLEKKTTVEGINKVFEKAAKKEMKGIIEYSEEELVSSDIIHNPASAVIDALSTKVINSNLVKVLAWYDNEWAYSCRMMDMLKMMI